MSGVGSGVGKIHVPKLVDKSRHGVCAVVERLAGIVVVSFWRSDVKIDLLKANVRNVPLLP